LDKVITEFRKQVPAVVPTSVWAEFLKSKQVQYKNVPDVWRKDKDLLVIAVESEGEDALEYAHKDLKNSPDYMKLAERFVRT